MDGNIVSGITRYVTYFIAPKAAKEIPISSLNSLNSESDGPTTPTQPSNSGAGSISSGSSIATSLGLNFDWQQKIIKPLEAAIEKYLGAQPEPREVIASFLDTPDNRRTTKWPQLKKAIQKCLEQDATLLIAELGTFTNNETFAKLILDANINFCCCDQPFIDRGNLEALFKHAQIQKQIHGNLIKNGLKKSPAKSGNPNANEVIRRVNQPKIFTAIMFAYLIKPLIDDYTKKGYSQRQMVKMLNDENFSAPEGGKWVLSQLQKVLDRVKLNDVIDEVGDSFQELKQKNLTAEQIAAELTKLGASPLKKQGWDGKQIEKLSERMAQLQEIVTMNAFIEELFNVIHDSKAQSISTFELMKGLAQSGLKIKQIAALPQ
jgi:hypothetical protein